MKYLYIELCNQRLNISSILIALRKWSNNLKANVMGHPINVLIRFDRIVRQLSSSVAWRQVLVEIKVADILNEQSVEPVLTDLTQGANQVPVLGNGASSVLIPKTEV